MDTVNYSAKGVHLDFAGIVAHDYNKIEIASHLFISPAMDKGLQNQPYQFRSDALTVVK